MGPGVELVRCDLLREGAPIEPVPPVTHWKPDAVVREPTAHSISGVAVGLIFFLFFSPPDLLIPKVTLLPTCLCSCPVKCLLRLAGAKVNQYISALA